jgi:bifunctional enzyme CysN/CysC
VSWQLILPGLLIGMLDGVSGMDVSERRMARELLDEGEFIEVFVDTPPWPSHEIRRACTRRPVRGEIKNFTGIDSPYEPPATPEIHIDTTTTTAEAAAELVLEELRRRGILEQDFPSPES